MMSKVKKGCLCMVLALSVMGTGSLWASESPSETLESFFKNVNEIKFPIEDAADYERAMTLANASLDIMAMGKKALADHWGDLGAEEQEKFSELLEKLIGAIAYPRTQKFLSSQTVSYAEPKTTERGAEVLSTMKSSKTGLEIPIVYDLYRTGEEWRIDDVYLDGISMTEDLQYQFDKILSEGGPAELLKQMQLRLERANLENGLEPLS